MRSTLPDSQLSGFVRRSKIHAATGEVIHEIGKLGIRDAILHKPGPLNDEERVIIRALSGTHLDPAVVEVFFRNAPASDVESNRSGSSRIVTCEGCEQVSDHMHVGDWKVEAAELLWG